MSSTLTSRWNSLSTKEKSHFLSHKAEEDLAWATIIIENPAVVSTISRNTSHQVHLSLLLSLEQLQLLAAPLPGPSLTRTKQPSGSHIWWWLTLVLPTALHRGILINLPTITPYNRFSSVLCGHCDPRQHGSSLKGSDVVDTGPASSLPWSPMGSHVWAPLLKRPWKDWKE